MHDIAKPEIPRLEKKVVRRKLRRAIYGVLGLAVILIGIKALQIFTMASAGKKMIPPPETVTSAVVTEEKWAPMRSAVGTITAVQGAMVSTELPGIVAKVAFESGSMVKKGDLLVELDTSSEQAQLQSAAADLDLARADVERARDLVARKVISRAEIDAAETKFKQKSAMVDQMRSMTEKKTLRAPFDAAAGIRQVNVGQMVNAGQEIVSLQALDPVFVDFALPEKRLPELAPGLEVRVMVDAMPEREFVGKLTAINSAVDVVTRNVKLQATLENHEHILRPGMFAKVNVVLPQQKPSLVIPATAVLYAPFGDSVFVIEKKKDEKTGKESQIIRQQFIRIAETRGDFVAVTTGLKAGQTVVSSGVFKLRNGMAVTINNDLAPKPQVNPSPADS